MDTIPKTHGGKRVRKLAGISGRCKVVPVTNLVPPIWNKQPKETFKSFERFQLYRDLGGSRTIACVVREVGLTDDARMSDVSIRWRWQERAEAWDKHLDEVRQKAIIDAAQTMVTRQAKLGMVLQDKALTALENIDMSEVTVRDVVALADTGVKIERLARGERVEENAQVIINLPMMPSWARSSPFVKAEEVKTLTEGDEDNADRTDNTGRERTEQGEVGADANAADD